MKWTMIAGLTAVDGATVITDQYELIAFGAKITRRDSHARVDQVRLTEPIDGTGPTVVPSDAAGWESTPLGDAVRT